MSRSRRNLNSIYKTILAAQRVKLLDNRRRRLYNFKYRKSIFFVSIWIGRVTYFLLYFIVCFTHELVKTNKEEVIFGMEVNTYQTQSQKSGYSVTEISMETNYGDYSANLTNVSLPKLSTGDTITIAYNYYGKPIFFTKNNWHLMYGLENNLIFYSFILFLTFISFFFNDGYDSFTDKLLLIVWTANIIALGLYFFTHF